MASRVTPPAGGPPVTVLRAAIEPFPQHGVLGVVRSLGRWGVPAILAAPDPVSGIAGASRFVRAHRAWDPAADGIASLRSIADRYGRSIAVPTDDASAAFLQEHAEPLADVCTFPVLPPGSIDRLLDKVALAAAAEAAGIATPMTRAVTSVAEVDDVCAELGLPVVVKAAPGPRPPGVRSVVVCSTRADVVEAIRTGGRVIVQEHVAGSPRRVNWIFDAYFDRSGRCVFWATGRKLSQHPPYAGTATHAVAERNDALARPVIAFLEGLGYVGPVDVDLRVDERDGRAMLLDVNPRVGGTFRVFVSPEGLDVIRCAYLDLAGHAVPDVAVRDGRAWILESHVATGVLPYRRDGWLTSRGWLGSLRGVDEVALTAADDLRPAVRAAAHVAARATASLRRRVHAGRPEEAT